MRVCWYQKTEKEVDRMLQDLEDMLYEREDAAVSER